MVKASTPEAVEQCHELLRWIIPHLNRFPRQHRFTLGERIESGLLELLAGKRGRKKGTDLFIEQQRVEYKFLLVWSCG